MANFPGFIGPSYRNQSVNAECQRTVNLFLQVDEARTAGNGETGALFPCPGLTLLQTIAPGPIRGAYLASNGILYVVAGQYLYSVDSSWAVTQLGQLSTTTGHVQMVDNSYQLCIVDGQGYVWRFTDPGNGTSRFVPLAGVTGWQGSNIVGVIDGWGVFAVPGTNEFYTSNQDDFTTFNGTPTVPSANFAFKAGKGDPIVGIICSHELVWILGRATSEIWSNTGNATGIVLSRIPGALIETGCCSANSAQNIANTIVWLGDGADGPGIVWQVQGGYVPQRISTHAVEVALQSYGYENLKRASAWSYQEDGHGFYLLNVPGAPVTWCYDCTTGQWHERMHLVNGQESRHQADCHAWAYGQHVVGDYQTGNLYALDKANATDNGQPRKWIRVSPHSVAGGRRVIYSKMFLDMETGIGLDGKVAFEDPQVSMRYSDDAGHTWSHSRSVSAGAIGGYRTRAIWRQLGSARNRVFEFSGSDPVSYSILGAQIEAQAAGS